MSEDQAPAASEIDEGSPAADKMSPSKATDCQAAEGKDGEDDAENGHHKGPFGKTQEEADYDRWWTGSMNPNAATPGHELSLLLRTKRNRQGDARPTHPRALAQAMVEFNKQFAVVLMGGDAVIFAFAQNQGQKHETLKPGTFHLTYAPLRYQRQKDAGAVESKAFSRLWIESEERRTYFNVTFDPSGRLGDDDTLNLWNGFAVKPVKGDWSLLRRHIFEVVCRGNILWFTWLLCWMADIVQSPANKPGTAVVVRGLKGTGKTIVAEFLSKLMPSNALSLSRQGQLTGRFNDHLAGKLFVTVEEAIWAGDKNGEGVMKDMITSPTQTVEGKHKGVITVPNHLRLWYSTNADWAVPATWDERRFFVLQTSDEHKEEKAYFDAIHKQMAKGGLEAMMYDLQKLWKPHWLNLRHPPRTPFLSDQVEHNLETTEAWWQSVLSEGAIIGDSSANHWPGGKGAANGVDAADDIEAAVGIKSNEPPDIKGGLRVTTKVVGTSYRTWCKDNRKRYPVTDVQLGKFLASAGVKKSRPRAQSDRILCYDFPPIAALRRDFTAKYGIGFNDGEIDEGALAVWGLDDAGTWPDTDIQVDVDTDGSWCRYADGDGDIGPLT